MCLVLLPFIISKLFTNRSVITFLLLNALECNQVIEYVIKLQKKSNLLFYHVKLLNIYEHSKANRIANNGVDKVETFSKYVSYNSWCTIYAFILSQRHCINVPWMDASWIVFAGINWGYNFYDGWCLCNDKNCCTFFDSFLIYR